VSSATEAALPPLTVNWVALCAGIGHVSLSASRVVVSLFALHQGGNAATVGLLLALYALVPTLTSISVGRMIDRIGAKPVMLFSLMLCALGLSLPLAFPHIHTLWFAAALIGGGWSGYQGASQGNTGRLSEGKEGSDRTRNFARVSLAVSLSSMGGPVMAGFAVDLIGHRATFALVALFPLACALLVGLRQGLPPLSQALTSAAEKAQNTVWDLLQFPGVRRSLVLSAVMAMAWDAHTLLVPVYGTIVKLSASQVGVLLGSFGLATFAIRLVIHRLISTYGEQRVIMGALCLIGVCYVAYPLLPTFYALVALSFVIGFGCGGGQPITLAELHNSAPKHRVGEAVGLRIAVSNFVAMLLPLVLGALATSFGMTPVFWAMAIACFASAWMQRRVTT
jgi:predicted MFS family arabinose efflux permease